jgi:hypothetical protein
LSIATTTTAARKPLSDGAAAILIALFALVVYFITLCPTIFADDCGEIATAVATGGVMHPPGYPLYTLIGQLFIKVVPWGESAHRLGLLSCVCAAAAVAVTFLLARLAGAGRAWSVAGALTLAFSQALWMQATKVETYALNALLVSLLLYGAFVVSKSASPKTFLATALCGGLALTNHLTVVWLIPALAVLTLPTLYRKHGAARFVGLLVAAIVLCLAPLPLYLTEMVAARSHPGGQIWGDPSNFHRLWLHVTGARYHSLFQVPTLEFFYQRDIVFASSWLWQNMGLMLVAAVIGLAVMLRDTDRRPLAIGLIVGVVGYLACNTMYHILNIFEYYTTTVLMLSVAAAVGADFVFTSVRERAASDGVRAGSILGSAAVALTCIAPIVLHWTECDRSDASYMRGLAQNTLRSVPQDAIVIAAGDNNVFPLWYVQEVLRERPDVAVIPRQTFDKWTTPVDRELTRWMAERLQRQHPAINALDLMDRAARDAGYADRGGPVWDTVRSALERRQPVYLTDLKPGDTTGKGDAVSGALPLSALPGAVVVSEGILNRVYLTKDVPSLKDRVANELAIEKVIEYDLAPPILFAQEPDKDITNRRYGLALNKTANLMLKTGDISGGLDRAQRAVLLMPNSAAYANTFAYACIMSGKREDAIAEWKRATELDPTNADYARNLQTALQEAQAAPKAQ